jgi:hypothetical protein
VGQSGAPGFAWNVAASGTVGGTIAFTQAMTLDANGSLGIGTTSPQTKLHVAGEAAYWASGNDAFRVVPLAAGSGSKFLSTNSANNAYAPAIIDGSINVFQTSGTERARITAGGNLLVGTTTDVSGRSGVISDVAGNVRAVPSAGAAKTSVYTLSITDVGDFVEIGTGGGIDVPNGVFATGDALTIFNNTTGARTISLTITTAYIAGTDADKASVSLATRGLATILFTSNSGCVITGNVS